MEYGNFIIALVGLAFALLVQFLGFAYLFGRMTKRVESLEESDLKRDEREEVARRAFDSKIDRVNASIERQGQAQAETARLLAIYAERLDGYARQLEHVRNGA